MKRPLVLATVCFTLGCLFALWGPLPGAMGLLGAGMTLVAALLLRTARARQTLWIAAVFMAAGSSLTLFRSVTPTPLFPEPYWKTGEIHGRVLEAPVFWPGIDYAQLLVETEQGIALVRWSDPPAPVFPGQRVSLQGDATTLIGNVNFGLSGPEDYYRILGVTHAVAVSGRALEVTDTPAYSLAYWIGRMRAWQGDLLSRSCPKETLPFLFAVWLGQRDRIDHASSQSYVDTGTAHMLSVSGLHVAIIYFSLEFLLSAFIKRERLRAVVILIAVFAFAFMAGARPSTLRAAIVIAMYLSARFVRREPDAPTALAVSALLLLLWNPRLLQDVGAILSFASVASLLCYAEPFTLFLRRRLQLPERFVSPLAACLAVQVLTLPLTAIWFHTLSFSSPLANLIAVPLLDAVLWGCVLIVAIGAALPPVAMLFGHAVWPAVAAIEGWVDFLAGFDMLSQLLPPPTAPALCCYYLAVLLPLILGGAPAQTEPVASAVNSPVRRRFVTASTICLLFASVLFWWPPQPRGQVDVLDVGHGDAAVIFPPGGGAVLIDAGDRSEYRDYGDSVVVPFLLAHGITHLDAIISTHPDRDHIGGIFTVLRELTVGKVLLSKLPSGKPLEAGLVTACRERGIPVERIGAGDLLEIGGARMEVLHPPPHGWSSPSVNNTSVVTRLSWPESDGMPFRMLFPGDIEEPAEVLIAQQDCHADILRVPHHGSFTSSTDAFLEAVSPQMAIVSTRTTARRNAMGPGVEERYAAHEIPLYRTDTHGGLRITGFPATLTSAREQRGYLPQSLSSTVAPVH